MILRSACVHAGEDVLTVFMLLCQNTLIKKILQLWASTFHISVWVRARMCVCECAFTMILVDFAVVWMFHVAYISCRHYLPTFIHGCACVCVLCTLCVVSFFISFTLRCFHPLSPRSLPLSFSFISSPNVFLSPILFDYLHFTLTLPLAIRFLFTSTKVVHFRQGMKTCVHTEI